MRHQSVHNDLAREDGFPTGALFGCLNSMLSMAKRFPKAGIVWVWDGMGETWRHTFMNTLPQLTTFKESTRKKKKGYKGNRTYNTVQKKKDKFPRDPRSRALLQIPVLQLVLKASGIRSYEIEGLECDDLLAMFCKQFLSLNKKNEVFIHSGDKDYYQLLSDRVKVLTRVKEGKPVIITKKDVRKKFGIRSKNWAKYEALTGGHNNVPHLHNIGSKRAKKMLKSGIDPSLEKAPKCNGFEKYFEPYGVKTLWPCINGNYKLCTLITDHRSSLLSDKVKAELAPLFRKLRSEERFYRREGNKTSKYYRRVSHLLSEYELASILGRRDILWQIP